MFTFARDHQPYIIFMDEVDTIGSHRISEGTSADKKNSQNFNGVTESDGWI